MTATLERQRPNNTRVVRTKRRVSVEPSLIASFGGSAEQLAYRPEPQLLDSLPILSIISKESPVAFASPSTAEAVSIAPITLEQMLKSRLGIADLREFPKDDFEVVRYAVEIDAIVAKPELRRQPRATLQMRKSLLAGMLWIEKGEVYVPLIEKYLGESTTTGRNSLLDPVFEAKSPTARLFDLVAVVDKFVEEMSPYSGNPYIYKEITTMVCDLIEGGLDRNAIRAKKEEIVKEAKRVSRLKHQEELTLGEQMGVEIAAAAQRTALELAGKTDAEETTAPNTQSKEKIPSEPTGTLEQYVLESHGLESLSAVSEIDPEVARAVTIIDALNLPLDLKYKKFLLAYRLNQTSGDSKNTNKYLGELLLTDIDILMVTKGQELKDAYGKIERLESILQHEPRAIEILRLKQQGKPHKQIATELGMSLHWVNKISKAFVLVEIIYPIREADRKLAAEYREFCMRVVEVRNSGVISPRAIARILVCNVRKVEAAILKLSFVGLVITLTKEEAGQLKLRDLREKIRFYRLNTNLDGDEIAEILGCTLTQVKGQVELLIERKQIPGRREQRAIGIKAELRRWLLASYIEDSQRRINLTTIRRSMADVGMGVTYSTLVRFYEEIYKEEEGRVSLRVTETKSNQTPILVANPT